MKLFQQKTVINKCETAKEFAEAYQIGKEILSWRARVPMMRILRR